LAQGVNGAVVVRR